MTITTTTVMPSSSQTNDAQDSYKLTRGDIKETLRLATQHYVLTTRQGYFLHPSVASAIQHLPTPRIADVATGTGIWAMELAEQIPHADVYGLDVTDAQYPSARWMVPPNLTLGVYDLLDDVPHELKGRFDVVHVRLLVGGGPEVDKEVFIDRFRDLLCEGGWLQWDELSWPVARECRCIVGDGISGDSGHNPTSVSRDDGFQDTNSRSESATAENGFESRDVYTDVAIGDRGFEVTDCPASHPINRHLMTQLGVNVKCDWISDFESVMRESGGFRFARNYLVPIRPSLLQVETDLLLTTYQSLAEVLLGKKKRNGSWTQKEEDLLHDALKQLHQETHGENSIRLSYAWNVCVAQKM